MRKQLVITHEFVEFVPDELQPLKLYVSIEYATAVHLCFCGCAPKVVTPISPTGWRLTYDRDTVSLHPSIGSWSLPCRSHYFVTRNCVQWAAPMSQGDIERGRSHDQAVREVYYERHEAAAVKHSNPKEVPSRKKSFWSWLTGG